MEQPKQAKKYLEVSPEDAKKIARRKADASGENDTLDEYWQALSEFGYYYGWQAIKDVLDDVIPIETMVMLTAGARKQKHIDTYDTARAVMYGYASAHSKNPDSVLKDLKTKAGIK